MKRISNANRVAWAMLAALATGLTASAQESAEGGSADYAIEYSAAANDVIIEYDVLTEIETTDETPLMRVYGDGKVHVHRPEYRVDAGDYELQLSQEQLESLLDQLQDDGVLSYDSRAAEAERSQARVANRRVTRDGRPILTTTSCADVTVVKVNLLSYRAKGARSAIQDYSRRIHCVNVKEAEELPQAEALQGFARAAAELDAPATSDALDKVTP